MRQWIKRAFIALFFSLLFIPGKAQDAFKTTVDKLNGLQAALPAHKLFVMHDKPSYVAGETIWLSTFLVDGTFHQLNASTNTIYIDLLDKDGKVVSRRMLHSPLGISWGQIDLPPSLTAGTYVLHGYTNYMRNMGEEYFFKKSIAIYNPQNLPAESNAQQKIDLQFFAESGHFLIGIENTIAFKAIGPNGLPVEISGTIHDETGTEVTTFQTTHIGMGKIAITPVPGKKYTARYSYGGQSEVQVELPSVEFSGYVLQVTRETDHFKCFIYRNTTDDTGEIGIMAQSRGVIRFTAQGKIGNSSVVNIPFSDLPTGITQITLFNADGRPLGERLVFMNHDKDLAIRMTTDAQTYRSREKVTVNAQIEDPAMVDKDTAEVFFSATVFDTRAYSERETGTTDIVSYLYLASDLTGHIQDPSYYFQDPTLEIMENADLLMLTQGWRRIKWESLNIPQSLEYVHERGVPIRGKITRAVSKKPYEDGNIQILNSNGGIATTTSNEEGLFFNDELVFYDSTELVIETESKKGNQSEFDLTVFPPSVPASLKAELPDVYGPSQDYLQTASQQVEIDEGYKATSGAIMLDEVQITEERIKNEVIKYYGMADRTLTTENLPKSTPNIIESIRGRFAGVLISGSPLQPTVSIRGGGTPLYLLDGIVVNQSTILVIPPDQIASVDLIKGNNAAIFGADGANGVLAFYTKSGYQDYSVRSLGMNTVKYKGFSPVKEFYQPRYDVEADRNDLPDMRTTLFWSPLLKCSPDGQLSFDFFTADSNGTYQVILQGISLEGNPGAAVYEFQVID